MKKTLFILSLLLLLPSVTRAAITDPWIATSTDPGYIQPQAVVGINPFLKILSISTSTFSNGINLVNGCFSVGGVCVGDTGGTNFWTLVSNVLSNNSGNILNFGPNGATNPVLQVDGTTASQADGITIKGGAAGNGTGITAISSGGSSPITINSKGASNAVLNAGAAGGLVELQVGASNRLTLGNQATIFTTGTNSGASTVRYSFAGGADTNLTLSTEAPEVYFNLGQTRQSATGALALQRDFRYTPGTHTFVGASALTDFEGFSIDGAPIAGNNNTTASDTALYIGGQNVMTGTGAVTNSYGLSLFANTGATNNYAAQFMGGNVGIGTSTPGSLLSLGDLNGGINFSTATSTFGTVGGVNLIGGCYAINGVCLGSGGGAVSSVSNSDGSLTISPTTGLVVASLNLAHSNAFTASQSIQSTSASAFTVGANGATNPALQVDASGATSATGLDIISHAAGSGVNLIPISSATNESLFISSKGVGVLQLMVGGTQRQQINSTAWTAQSNNNYSFATNALATAATTRFLFTGTADTALTASTNAISTWFNMGQVRQHATGALAFQTDFRISPSTHGFVGASTLTDAEGLSIDGAPIAGTNATISSSSDLVLNGQNVGAGVINSYGLSVNANSGATNNFAAEFLGGNVGVGTSTPTASFTSVAASTTAGTVQNKYQGLVSIVAGLENTTVMFFQEIDQWGHLITSGDTPVLSSCGISPTIVGNDRNGTATAGSTATGCSINFAHAYLAAPTCTVTDRNPSLTNVSSYNITSTQIVFSQGNFGGDVIDYICQGSQ